MHTHIYTAKPGYRGSYAQTTSVEMYIDVLMKTLDKLLYWRAALLSAVCWVLLLPVWCDSSCGTGQSALSHRHGMNVSLCPQPLHYASLVTPLSACYPRGKQQSALSAREGPKRDFKTLWLADGAHPTGAVGSSHKALASAAKRQEKKRN